MLSVECYTLICLAYRSNIKTKYKGLHHIIHQSNHHIENKLIEVQSLVLSFQYFVSNPLPFVACYTLMICLVLPQQYEDAIKMERAGRPVNYGELPELPDFPPLPTTKQSQSSTPAAAQPAAVPAARPSQPTAQVIHSGMCPRWAALCGPAQH